jgi:hypothetical protein
MDDVPMFHLIEQERQAIAAAIEETIQFFEGMKVGIGVTTAEDLDRRLVELRKAQAALAGSSWT